MNNYVINQLSSFDLRQYMQSDCKYWIKMCIACSLHYSIVMNQVGNSKFPPSDHLIFFSTNSNEK
jgi:hypothetical protein